MSDTTPMMAQYLEIKEQYRDAVLFFRLGDFYEMFNEDAVEVSRLLNLTLTHRAGNPMCGIPYHAWEGYADKLLSRGHRIAIVDQMEEAVDLLVRGWPCFSHHELRRLELH